MPRNLTEIVRSCIRYRPARLDQPESDMVRLIQIYLKSSYFFGRRVVCANRSPKKAGIIEFMFGVGCLPNGRGIWVAQHFGGFIHQIKVCQRKGRKDSIQAAYVRMRRLEAFLYLAAQNFELG
jgi:hypothetical protein